MDTQQHVHYLFHTGDCKGCDFYDEIRECQGSGCEVERVCGLLRTNQDFDQCMQLIKLRRQKNEG